MTDWIGRWLIGVTCAALVLAIAEALTPEGSIRRISKLAGGLVMLFTAISPVIKAEDAMLRGNMIDFTETAADYEQVLVEQNSRLYQSVIEENIAAYILDKAKAIGIFCSVEVVIACDDAGSVYPDEIYLFGNWSEVQRAELSSILYEDLGIELQKQHFERLEE